MVGDRPSFDGIHTPDHRYFVVRGRLWRATNPALSADDRQRLTTALMAARRAAPTIPPQFARHAGRVDQAKRALGERGPVWWTDGTPDYNRRLVANTPYHEWYHLVERLGHAILSLLCERGEGASICPSEVARMEEPRHWRAHMDAVRDVARHLARQDLVVITQRGHGLDPDKPFKGPVRFSSAATE